MRVLVVVTRNKLGGVFTQRKLLWAALSGVEAGRLKDTLMVARDVGRIKGANGERYARLTYPTLCRVLAEDDKADLHDFATEEIRYRVFVSETNRCRLQQEGAHDG